VQIDRLRTVHFKARIDLMQRWADHCEGVTSAPVAVA
jgi:hypothetical protein